MINRYRLLVYPIISLLWSCSGNQKDTTKAEIATFEIEGATPQVIKKFDDGKTQVAVYTNPSTQEKVAEVEFHPNGKPYIDKRYKGDALQGESYTYYADGTPWSLNTFKDGKYHGNWKTWWPNGQLRIHGFYQDGLATGEWFYYHDNGKIDTRGFYTNGKKTGVWSSYNREGVLVNEVNQDNSPQ